MKGLPRRSMRIRLKAEVRFLRASDRPYYVQLRNLSEDGCSVELINPVNVGEKVWIKLPGLEAIEGIVRWQSDFTAGVVFATPLHPAVLTMLIQRQGR